MCLPSGLAWGLLEKTVLEDISDIRANNFDTNVETVGARGDMLSIVPTSMGSDNDNIRVVNSDYVCMLRDNDPVLLHDASPCRDNIRGLQKNKTNMNFKKAGDAIYVGQVFKDKEEMRKALSVYSIKRLYNFKISASDKKRVIAVCAIRGYTR